MERKDYCAWRSQPAGPSMGCLMASTGCVVHGPLSDYRCKTFSLFRNTNTFRATGEAATTTFKPKRGVRKSRMCWFKFRKHSKCYLLVWLYSNGRPSGKILVSSKSRWRWEGLARSQCKTHRQTSKQHTHSQHNSNTPCKEASRYAVPS